MVAGGIAMELKVETTREFVRRQLDPKTGRFQKGHIPHNTGKRYNMRNNGTFDKGHLPHNTKTDGHISIRTDNKTKKQYQYIRIALGKWLPLHIHIWQQQHGSIPQGYVVVFRDGNTLNATIGNLLLISRAQNMQRNRNYEKASKTMRALWQSEKVRESYGLKLKTRLLTRKSDIK